MITRYSRPEMAKIWTDKARYETWLQIEIMAAEYMAKKGLVPSQALSLIKRKAKIDEERISEIEEKVKHDIIAFLTQLEETIGPEARYLHMGLTSSDVVDTSLAVLLERASDVIETDLKNFIQTMRALAKKYQNTPMVGRSHGIHAEPITFGLKVANWLSEALRNQERFGRARASVAYGKLSGAVGTFAHSDPEMEAYVCEKLHLKPEPIATQIVPRDRHAEYMSALALIGGMIERIATEIRHLQRTEVLEVEEPFTQGQKGSSAMPHKRNPIGCENICGLSRLIRGNMMAAYENIPLWHERDISHSSAERVILPDTTSLVNYALNRLNNILKGLAVYPQRMKANLQQTEEFLATQRIMLELINKGLERQAAYEMVQVHAIEAWKNGTSFRQRVEQDAPIGKHLTKKELAACFDLSNHFRNVKTLFKRVGI